MSLAHAANYLDGPMRNDSVGVVCPTHILKGEPPAYTPGSCSETSYMALKNLTRAKAGD